MKSRPEISENLPDGMLKRMESVLTENKDIKEKLNDLEDRSRRNNLRINGLSEDDNETPSETERKVTGMFLKDLGVSEIAIERAHRSGSKTYKDGNTNSKRVIVMKCLKYKDKETIFFLLFVC